jgi:hypothetical protein
VVAQITHASSYTMGKIRDTPCCKKCLDLYAGSFFGVEDINFRNRQGCGVDVDEIVGAMGLLDTLYFQERTHHFDIIQRPGMKHSKWMVFKDYIDSLADADPDACGHSYCPYWDQLLDNAGRACRFANRAAAVWQPEGEDVKIRAPKYTKHR